ncbi:type I polyketide synthase [Actinomadura sp. 6K520]|uniref:type I polyketide synthase n=1 Tax=Actinomadura sp. 6K520 TaxID=2530364 RepID=UPI0032600E73
MNAPRPKGDPSVIGQQGAEHALLGAIVQVPSTGTTLFTSQISLSTHSWLADHAVHGHVLFPGTALIDLALHAGGHTGAPDIEELTLETPLHLPEQGAVDLQITVEPPDGSDRRALSIHSRPTGDPDTTAWTRHATGTLTPHLASNDSQNLPWPPPGASQISASEMYERLDERGYRYGPAFQGVTRAWQDGDDHYADIVLPDGMEPTGYGIHPALLDAALHQIAFAALPVDGSRGETYMPFSFGGISLGATGATRLRVHIHDLGEHRVAVAAFDSAGRPVVTIESLTLRPSKPFSPSSVTGSKHLFELRWTTPTSHASRLQEASAAPSSWVVLGEDWPALNVRSVADLPALRREVTDGEEAPRTVLATPASRRADTDITTAAHETSSQMLRLLQDWLTDDLFSTDRLVVVTRGAVAALPDEEITDLTHAAVWGLVRTAQIEHPDRVTLIDLDQDSSSASLAKALATGEPQLVVRKGRALVPRMTRLVVQASDDEPDLLDPHGTVLITGGTGSLGAHIARHLVTRYGARHLLLVSRSGAKAAGASRLEAELTALGAEVVVRACDTADADDLASTLASVPDEHPLTAIVHAAGALDIAPLASLQPDQLSSVLRPKVDAAWHLDRLTEDMDLRSFVLFSSLAGSIGIAGQANYAAANSFLDALAHHRRSRGRPAASLAWGLWEEDSDLRRQINDSAVERMTRLGFVPLPAAQSLDLFDAAMKTRRTVVVPAHIDSAALRPQADAGTLPAVLRGLTRSSARRASANSSPSHSSDSSDGLAEHLLQQNETERRETLLGLVRSTTAAVLNHADPDSIGTDQAFKDLGIDSLTAVQLRNRLSSATGLSLPATLVFDRPSPGALTEYLLTRLVPADDGGSGRTLTEVVNKLESALDLLDLDDAQWTGVTVRLENLLRRSRGRGLPPADGEVPGELASATDEELFEALDNELESTDLD